MRKRLKQQFCWIAADTAKDFINQLNHAGDLSFELYSTYKVQDRFMGALMMRLEETEEVNSIPEPLPATILKLVPNDSRPGETETPTNEEGSALPEATDASRDAD